MLSEEEIYALKQFHEALEPGERVSMVGEVAHSILPEMHVTIIILFLCTLGFLALGTLTSILRLPPFGGIFALIAAVLVARKARRQQRLPNYVALTNRRILGVIRSGVYTMANRQDVKKIEGSRDKVSLIVSQAKKEPSEQDLRLGRTTKEVRIPVRQIRGLPQMIGQQQLSFEEADLEDEAPVDQ